MARLNEPPIAPAPNPLLAATIGAESVDALKRRFTRQNRDLARANSTQALHIQNLKHEVEKLVAQNQDLKELVLRLQGELGTSRAQASSVRTKIAELNGLMASLYAQEEDGELLSSQVIMSPTPRQFRERQPLAELMQETQMPTIAEHKSFPRRTLNAEDAYALRLSEHSSNGSPDLGPPPVAHFDGLEPITYSAERGPSTSETNEALKKSDDELLLASVETRRKRKDGPSKLEMRRSSILALSPAKNEPDASNTMLRTGAKRKLADREAEKPAPSLGQDDFTFSRRSPLEDVPTDEAAAVNTSWPESMAASPPRPARRALSDKSVNISPRKNAVVRSDKPTKDRLSEAPEAKKGRGENAASTRRSRGSTTSQQSSPPRVHSKPALPSPPAEDIVPPSVHDIILDDVELNDIATSLPPKTPAAPNLDVFSPPSSQSLSYPNTGSRASRDTPPPAEAGTSRATDDAAANAASRPSRRARNVAVNYAEPSLVAKMRRPGKEMVDAISGLQDPRCVMSSASGEGRKSVGGTVMSSTSASGTPAANVTSASASTSMAGASRRTVVIKTEPVEEDGRDIYNPGSPLNSKSASTFAPPSLSETRSSEAPASKKTSSATSTGRRRRDSTQAGVKPAAATFTDDDEDEIEEVISLHQQPRLRTVKIPSSSSSSGSRNSTKPTSSSTTTASLSNAEEAAAAHKRAEEIDLYDFKETSSASYSSPAESSSLAGSKVSHSGDGDHSSYQSQRSSSSSSSTAALAALAARTMTKQRRHSSVPKDLNSSVAAATAPPSHYASGGGGAGSLSGEVMNTAKSGDDGMAAIVGHGVVGRAERVAARRRSMMI
ncbi:uncharacterized protein K489DRAFT_433634 [Dissoconium aciculare CBS 342.82]|uniref:Shugoshin C-terminal domain-containing protein n=1 Tax=Dissoconium aciculare CBS 342.82 TaxID=1314786 RepID=A0A6J3LX09_9PEZI|nr:uncharacterized protein K489DRAFT_433634 [Dissoconium aciculare CBS 342.82]KAF1820193.1 hypothetical protein K489DRAFT_433634 [Dissoconium aciculare CBS 342.82]